MITVEEKLNTFSKLVYERVKKESETSLNSIHEKNNKILKEHREKIKKKAEKIIEKKIRDGEIKKREMISNANTSIKKQILNKKKEMLKDILQGVKNLAFEFTEKKEYENYFKKTFKEVVKDFKKGEKIDLYLTNKDLVKFDKFLNTYNEIKIDLKSADESIIGGVIAIKGDSFKIDASLKTLVEDNKDILGRYLYKELDKVGDYIE
ncbi:MAG: hypothetical protein FH753_05795 [Firmicutes bacterium]|nr:hypothetical protein [Bacillota bacterium]